MMVYGKLMIFNRLIIFIVLIFISMNGLAGRDDLIKGYLLKLENTEKYKSYGITTAFKLGKDLSDRDFLIIWLFKDTEVIGDITIILDAYNDGIFFIDR